MLTWKLYNNHELKGGPISNFISTITTDDVENGNYPECVFWFGSTCTKELYPNDEEGFDYIELSLITPDKTISLLKAAQLKGVYEIKLPKIDLEGCHIHLTSCYEIRSEYQYIKWLEQYLFFGSNLAGRHGKGAALEAVRHWGAIYGQGAGLQGNAYAITTKDHALRTLPLNVINSYVKTFLKYAAFQSFRDKEMYFNVTALGTGLAGYSIEDIAPMFIKGLDLPNISLNDRFKEYFYGKAQ